MLADGFGYARSIVPHAQADVVFAKHAQAHHDAAFLLAAMPPCVVAEVPHDLLQVGGIKQGDEAGTVGHVKAQAVFSLGIGEVKLLDEAEPELGEVDAFGVDAVAAVERGDVFQHFVDAGDVFFDDVAEFAVHRVASPAR